jgi:5-methylcytosine-specific restriction endonuclease McrA
MRARKTQLVGCKTCQKQYQKRIDCISNWSGLCKSCNAKTNKLGKVYVPRKVCVGCNKVSKYILAEVPLCRGCSDKKRAYRGAKHWNWKGGITTQEKLERSRFLKYQNPKVLERDNYTCTVCNQRGGSLQVDHIKSWATYPELRFDLDNCRTLCMGCHYQVTFNRQMPKGIVWGHNLSRASSVLTNV